MAGLSYLNATDWRYENSGTAELLSVSGTTLENLAETKSRTGTAFYQTTQAKCFGLPATSEVWIKFDVYFNGSTRWRAYDKTNGACGACSYSSAEFDLLANDSYVREVKNTLTANTLQTILLHMMSGASDGIVEAWVDGTKIYTYTGDVNHGEDFADIYLQSDGSGTFFSNVIISNVEIGLDENVAELIPAYDLEIKPEIYISWIPTGKIGLKPQIYASYIPAPIHEKITADLSRNVANPETSSGDLERKIGNGEKVSADVSRRVTATDTAIADTERKLSVEEKISSDTLKKIVQSAQIHADTLRDVQSTEKIIGDTARKIGVTTIRADLQRRVNVTTKTDGDTCRRVGIAAKISADTILRVTNSDTSRADTFREVKASTVANADTNRKIGVREKVSTTTRRLIAERVSAVADTLLQTVSAEKIIADTRRGLREFVRADTSRRVTRAQKAVAKTVIRVPHVLNYRLESKPQMMKASKKLLADNPLSLVNTFKDYGVTAINITLSEKTLSDIFTFDIASRSMDINEAVQGWLLDYPFSFLVEETNQTDLVQSVKGMYSLDLLLYTQFFIPTVKIKTDDEEKEYTPARIKKRSGDNYDIYYLTATDAINEISAYFGTLPVVLIDDFTPYNLNGDSRVTYVDLMNSIFGWTSRLPQRQINVFIRGGILYCIQRGKEPTIFDITDLQHSRPTVKKRLLRSLWSNPKVENESGTGKSADAPDNPDDLDDDNDDDDNSEPDPYDDYDTESVPIPYSGTIEFEGDDYQTTLQYSIGLLKKEYHRTENGKATVTSSTTFSYTSDGNYDEKTGYPGYYLKKKETTTNSHVNNDYVDPQSEDAEFAVNDADADFTDTKQVNTVTYQYKRTGGGDIYLLREKDITTTETYEKDPATGKMELEDTATDIRETLHMPLGNGWYGQVVYINGECQGSNISHGKPGNKVSQFSIDEFQRTFSKEKQNPNPDNNGDTGSTGGDSGDSGDSGDGGGTESGGTEDTISGGDDDSGNTGDNVSEENYDDWRRKLAPVVDTSFPVREFDLLRTLTNALLWLNRKTQETVTVDLISRIVDGVPEINHIVDFTERILFNGAEYFLVSNQISFTPRKLIQKLTLIRWY